MNLKEWFEFAQYMWEYTSKISSLENYLTYEQKYNDLKINEIIQLLET